MFTIGCLSDLRLSICFVSGSEHILGVHRPGEHNVSSLAAVSAFLTHTPRVRFLLSYFLDDVSGGEVWLIRAHHHDVSRAS